MCLSYPVIRDTPNLVAAGASVYGELELLLLSSAARSMAPTIE